MEISTDLATWGISGALSAGVAFGIIKGTMHNFMTYEKHRDICEKERQKTDDNFDKLFNGQKELHGMLKEIHGYIKAKNGGQL